MLFFRCHLLYQAWNNINLARREEDGQPVEQDMGRVNGYRSVQGRRIFCVFIFLLFLLYSRFPQEHFSNEVSSIVERSRDVSCAV